MTTPETRQTPPPPATSARWPALRFLTHELRLMASLVRWAARRRHGVDGADAFFSHGRDQAIMMYGLTFACVVETVALSYLLADWPVIHTVLLVVDVYTVLFVLGLHAASVTRLHAASVTRPHVLADGALRIRQAAHVDVRVPARPDRLRPARDTLHPREEGRRAEPAHRLTDLPPAHPDRTGQRTEIPRRTPPRQGDQAARGRPEGALRRGDAGTDRTHARSGSGCVGLTRQASVARVTDSRRLRSGGVRRPGGHRGRWGAGCG